MTEQVSEPHILVVEGFYDGIYDYEIEHPSSCPKEKVSDDPFSPDHEYEVYTCLVQYEIDNVGLDSLTEYGDKKLKPGKYKIEGWAVRYPSTPLSSEEWDAGLRFIEGE